MLSVQFNMDDIAKMADRVGGAIDQVPFVLSQLLNDGAFKTRQVLVSQTWPRSVNVRNPGFVNAALHVERSTKQNLRVVIEDTLNRGHLKLHASGGTKMPHGQRLAIPAPGTASQGAHGIVKRDRPRGLIARTSRRALRITARGIFVGEGGRLHLRYSFQASAAQPKDVPFYEDFDFTMRAAVRTGFADAMRKAMATRR